MGRKIFDNENLNVKVQRPSTRSLQLWEKGAILKKKGQQPLLKLGGYKTLT
jgi:hypothetical protein